MVPQDALPQLTLQVTPALFGSLFTVAANPVLVPVLSDVAGGLRKETEIGTGGVGPEPDPPLQPTTNKAITDANTSLSERWNVTGDLHSARFVSKRVPVYGCGLTNHDRYG